MRTKTVPSKTPKTRPDRICRPSETPSSWVSFKDASRLLGDDPYFWGDENLHAVLRHYNVDCRPFTPNAAKTILVHELCLLLGKLKGDDDKIPSKHRSCILRLAKVGPTRPFVHLLLEILRYHINCGNLNEKAEDYPYIVTLDQSEAEAGAALTTSTTQAIHEDYQRVYQFYKDGRIQDLEDEQNFARLLNESPNPRVTYTQKAFDRWASRFVQFLKGTGYEEHHMRTNERTPGTGYEEHHMGTDKGNQGTGYEDHHMETDEDQTPSSQSINQDLLMSEDSATTQGKSSEVEGQFRSRSNSVTSVSDETGLGDFDYIPDKMSTAMIKRVSRVSNPVVSGTVKSTPEYIEIDETEDLPESADYETDTDSVIARTTGRYGTLGKGRCPSCAKLHMVVKEQHHAPTLCLMCGNAYCWKCKADWAGVDIVGRLGHQEYCSRYPQALRSSAHNDNGDGVRAWVRTILARVQSSRG